MVQLSRIMMIGDRFDTDIRAGLSAGVMTCLVESGAHAYDRQADYPDDPAFFVPASLQAKVAEGKFGRKSGEGYYKWDGDKLAE